MLVKSGKGKTNRVTMWNESGKEGKKEEGRRGMRADVLVGGEGGDDGGVQGY